MLKKPLKFQFRNTKRRWNFCKKPKTFLNKGTKHKKNHMECLNYENKNSKGGGSL